MKPVESDRLDAEERRELSSSDFGIPEERAPDARCGTCAGGGSLFPLC